MTTRKTRTLSSVATLAVLALAATACGGSDIDTATDENKAEASSAASKNCGTINMAVNPWVSYEASAYVVGTVADIN